MEDTCEGPRTRMPNNDEPKNINTYHQKEEILFIPKKIIHLANQVSLTTYQSC